MPLVPGATQRQSRFALLVRPRYSPTVHFALFMHYSVVHQRQSCACRLRRWYGMAHHPDALQFLVNQQGRLELFEDGLSTKSARPRRMGGTSTTAYRHIEIEAGVEPAAHES